MTKTIVVPLDGSEYAERALPTAAWLADGLGAKVRLVTTTFDADPTTSSTYLEEQAAATKLDEIDVKVLREVFPGSGIVDTCDALPYGALCMTTRGRGPFAQVLLGSVADEVLRLSTSPVVLVGPSCDPGTVGGPEVVVCVDDSHGSTALLPVVGDWAARLGLVVHVVAVDPATSLDEPGIGNGEQLLQDAANHLAAMDVTCETHLLRSSHPADVLLAFAAARDAALVAVSAHGHGGVDSALGAVARHVVRHSRCPVHVRR